MAGREFETTDSISLDSEVKSLGFDLTAYAVALAFNSVALPAGMTETAKSAVLARAADIREAAKEGSVLDVLSDAGAKEKRRKDADETASVQAGFILQQQQREREEWLERQITVAGTTMKGAQWQELSKRLREDEGFRERLMQLYIARGMSKEQAEARVDRVAEVAEIAATPESQRTDEQRDIIRNAQVDPSFKRDVADAEQVIGKENKPIASSELNGSFAKAVQGPSTTATEPVAAAQPDRRVTATIDAGL